MRILQALAILSLLICFRPTEVRCQEQVEEAQPEAELLPRHRMTYSNLLVVRYNPLGLEDAIDLGYRLRLYNNPGILWRDAHVGLAFTPTIAAALARVGGTLTVKPIAVLTLRAGYYFVGWFGTFGYVYSTESALDPHSDDAINTPTNPGQGYATTGRELELSATVAAKVKNVVLRSTLTFYNGTMDLKDQDALYYQVRIDALVPNSGWALTNDTDLVYLFDSGLVAGLRATLVHAVYDNNHFNPGETIDNPNTPTFRAGPLLAYVFFDDPNRLFNKPTALLMANWWFKHRYRTGQEVNQAIPWVVLGFKFEGDLWHRE